MDPQYLELPKTKAIKVYLLEPNTSNTWVLGPAGRATFQRETRVMAQIGSPSARTSEVGAGREHVLDPYQRLGQKPLGAFNGVL